MSACTCGGRSICLTCQLADLQLVQAADLLLLDPFVVAAAEMDRRLADAFASGLTERERNPRMAQALSVTTGNASERFDSAASRSVSPSNVHPIRPPKGQL